MKLRIIQMVALLIDKRNNLLLFSVAAIFTYFVINGYMVEPGNQGLLEFKGFNNVTGADHMIVPNIIHYIYFNKREMNFVDYVVIRSAMRNHKPDKFYIHSNIQNFILTGKYWDWVCDYKDLRSRIEFHYLELPTEIFGRELSVGWRNYHGSDIGRLKVLMKYGGIYLDNDVYVIQNLDKYRKYEFVINWDENQFIGNQILIAHKDARFLREWLETYKAYDSSKWYYNGGELPTTYVLYHQPELIHRVKGDFGVDVDVSIKLYTDTQFEWRKLDAIHLLINHRSYLDDNYNKTSDFNETNILTYEYPFGEMAREVINT